MIDTIRLTDEEIASYDKRGYLGPYDVAAPELIATVGQLVEDELLTRVSPIYGMMTGRDWHLASRPFYDLCAHPAIVERVAGVLGPDIVLWRSQMFYKKPGDPETTWHQGYAFPGPFNAPSIDPPVAVTVWIALDDATIENGCVDLVVGTHKQGRLATVQKPGGDGIFGRHYMLERGILETDEVVQMAIPRGQFFFFSNALMHGSGPNRTEAPRRGIAVRYTSTNVRVYPGLSVDGQGMSLENFGCILVHGENRYDHNAMRLPPNPDDRIEAAHESSAKDTGFRMAYSLGFRKGTRHAAKGARIDVTEHADKLVAGMSGHAKQYADPDQFAVGLNEGLAAGYSDGIEGRPFDTRYGSPPEMTQQRSGGPVRRALRGVKRLLKGR